MYRIKYVLIALTIIMSTHYITAQSIDFDKKMGKNNFEIAVNTYGLYNDSSMNKYINKLGQRLVSKLDTALFEYKFYILDNELPNAFALPGGYIFITKGIIPIINTEDELAGIIGHEIIHSNNRHTIRQIRKRVLPTLITLPVNIASQISPTIGVLASPIITAENMLFAKYSRKFETEADKQGVILAARAGYDPTALTRVLNRLSKTLEYITGEEEKKNYLADHPYTPDREKNINSISKDLSIKQTNKISKNFLQEFSGIVYGTNPNKGVLKENAIIQLKRDFYIQYPKLWKVRNMDTLIVGYNPAKTAIYTLNFDNSKLSPEKAAKKYEKSISQKHKDFIVKSAATKVNGADGYIISFEEPSYNDTTFAYISWFVSGNNLLNISIMSDVQDNKTMQDITKSIRHLTEQEKKSVMVKYLSIVKANENETIADLCKRTNNKSSIELIYVLNGIDKNTKLNKDREIKIILERPFLQ